MPPVSPTPALLTWLATLSDLARLRILRLLATEELSVGELALILQLPQSTVSRHLKLLSDGGWIVKRAAGTASLYRMAVEALPRIAQELWEATSHGLGDSPTFDEDDRRLAEILAHRRTDSKAFFGHIGGEWDALRRQLFGESFTTQALVTLLDPKWIVADLGCGTGNVTEHLAPIVKQVIAVDREPAMLDAARRRLGSFSNIEFRQGELTKLPIADDHVDAAIMFLVGVYLPDPAEAFGEIARILRQDSAALIVDLTPHDRESYRHTMGHQHLGFDEKQIKRWAKAAGLANVRYQRLKPDTAAKGPGLFVATMRKK